MPLRPGQWVVNAVVKGSSLSVAKTGTQQLEVGFTTDDPNTPSISAFLYLTDKALPQTIDALTALGWRPEDHDFNIAELNGTATLVGKQASLVLEKETYEGKTHSKVRFINRLGGVREAMAPEAAGQFATTLRDRLRAACIAKGAKPSSAPVALAGANDEEQKQIDAALKNMPF